MPQTEAANNGDLEHPRIDTRSASAAKESLQQMDKRAYRKPADQLRDVDELGISLFDLHRMDRGGQRRTGYGRNNKLYTSREVGRFLVQSIVRQDDGDSIITTQGIEMAQQSAEAAQILEDSRTVFEEQLKKFRSTSDAAIAEAKKRTGQLNDYNKRLATALDNLNQKLGDERMARALDNADKITNALALLDELEQRGKLDRIMRALSGGE